MVEFVNQKDVTKFVCAAGILAHYVADACQPLHASQFHDGRPDHADEKGVHSYYETKMLDRFAVDIIGKINEELKGASAKADLRGGKNSRDFRYWTNAKMYEVSFPTRYNQSV